MTATKDCSPSGTASAPSLFHKMPAPERAIDTRKTAPVAAGRILTQQVAGVYGVPANATAVVLSVTVTSPDQGGHLIVAPTGSGTSSSSVNFEAGGVRNNSAGASHIIVDISGYCIAGTATQPGAFVPLEPDRIMDTRKGLGIPRLAAGRSTLPVAGQGGVPSTGADAVVMNVTITQPERAGDLAVLPKDAAVRSSNLNFVGGQTVPNLVISGLAGGAVDLVTNSPTHALADVPGCFRS